VAFTVLTDTSVSIMSASIKRSPSSYTPENDRRTPHTDWNTQRPFNDQYPKPLTPRRYLQKSTEGRKTVAEAQILTEVCSSPLLTGEGLFLVCLWKEEC